MERDLDLIAYAYRQKSIFQKSERNFITAHKVLRNIQETNSYSDAELTFHNLDYRIMNEDPVAKKLNWIYKNRLHNHQRAGEIRGIINDRHLADISLRRMSQEIYQDLLETPAEYLIARWAAELESKCSQESA